MNGIASEAVDALTPITVDEQGGAGLHLRPGSHVMDPQRAIAATANALSFSRAALRQFVQQRWRLECLRFEVDRDGRGEILYRFSHGKWIFHFFVLSDCFPAEMKVDRNFGVNWDAIAMLCEGEWTDEREALLKRELPKARAGINDYDCLIYARGNRSGRLFDQVVDALTQGIQPDGKALAHIGYILRTTAFIGNGAIGTKPLAGYPSDHPLKQPYHAQMCAGFLLREYVCDLVDRMAYIRNPQGAVSMSPAFRRYLGIGNSAATGLLPFLVHRPKVIHQWCLATETAFALAGARRIEDGSQEWSEFVRLTEKAIAYFRQDQRDVLGVFIESDRLANELERVLQYAEGMFAPSEAGNHVPAGTPWERLLQWSDANLHAETGEVLRSIILELYPDIVDSLTDKFKADEYSDIDPGMSLVQLGSLLAERFSWALKLDVSAPDATHYFWYRSKAAPLDMRRGVRGRIPGDEHEMGTELVLKLHQLRECLALMPTDLTVAELLLQRPDLRYTVARVQSTDAAEYAELRTNYLDKGYIPYAAIRLVLAFYGMEKLTPAHPKSVRGALLQGAPTAKDIEEGRDGDWPFPLVPQGAKAEASVIECTPLPKPEKTNTQPLKRDLYTISPTELARFSQKALQGSGVDLTASIEGSEAVSVAQALWGAGIGSLLSALSRGRQDAGAPMADLSRLDSGIAVLRSRHVNALSIAQESLDLACVGARSNPGRAGIVHVQGAVGLSLLDRLVLQAARRGFFGCLAWWSPEGKEGLGKARVAMAASSSDASTWFVAEQQEAPSELYAQIAHAVAEATEGDWGSSLLARFNDTKFLEAALSPVDASRSSEIKPGFIFLCVDPARSEVAMEGLYERCRNHFNSANVGPYSVCLDGKGLHHALAGALSTGVSIPVQDWDRLIKYAAELLVDPEDEEALRPNGLDPQIYL